MFDVAQENTAETSTVRTQRDEGVESETQTLMSPSLILTCFHLAQLRITLLQLKE